MKSFVFACSLAAIFAAQPALADPLSEEIAERLESNAAHYNKLASNIWRWAELGYQETRSSKALQAELRKSGFKIETGVAGMPTAFVASYGSGTPVLGILAEFDALPGLSQQVAATRSPVEESAPGHACGHHLFGTASTAAAIEIKHWLKRKGGNGTIRVYGTPAEEGGSGKVYMVREGRFADVDVALHWHPSDTNGAGNFTTLANKSAKFRFHGVAAHAAKAPERGRSALDAVEAMNYMVNLMREHVPQETRIHYVITKGGTAPNIVPELAEVYYYVRSTDAASLAPIWQRVEQAARGAALGTSTDMTMEVIHGNHSILPNTRLSAAMNDSLQYFGGVDYSEADQALAEQLYASYAGQSAAKLGDEKTVMPWTEQVHAGMGSSDVGDVSWTVPMTGLSTATWVPGTSAHSWQAVAAGGSDIGMKGMLLAAKTLARTGIELMKNPALVEQAKVEFDQRRGQDFEYRALLGDREPPLDYRR